MTIQIDRARNDFIRAQRLEQGEDCATDLEAAASFYRRAALRGLPEAQHALGFLYATGQGLERDERMAVRWFEVAAAGGHASAAHNLAVMLAEGRGTEKDEQAAVRWFYEAAMAGSPDAQEWLEERQQPAPEAGVAEEGAGARQ